MRDPEHPEKCYELLDRRFGEERAARARLPGEDRERELHSYHERFNTSDDLAEGPPKLDGGVHNT